MPAADQRADLDTQNGGPRRPDGDRIARFSADLDRLLPGVQRLGVAVSGGPDSLALLLLAATVRPGQVEAATVDHGLRAESTGEAAMVAEVCETLGVPHTTLPVTVAAGASLQAQAREARYETLVHWANRRRRSAVLTAHHADDQAETLLMRLARGAGLGGLAGIRPVNRRTGDIPLVRPLLGWRKRELQALVHSAGLRAVDDPANSDPRHDRTHARNLLAAQHWLSPERIAASAAHLADAEEALLFIADRLFSERGRDVGEALQLDAKDLPRELQRRLLLLAFHALGAAAPRGPDLERALTTLADGGICTLAGIRLEGGALWRLAPAPPRR